MKKAQLKELIKKSHMKEGSTVPWLNQDKNTTEATLDAFEAKLKSHNWFHYNTIGTVYDEGMKQKKEILDMLKALEGKGLGDAAKELYNKYARYEDGGVDLRLKEEDKQDDENHKHIYKQIDPDGTAECTICGLRNSDPSKTGEKVVAESTWSTGTYTQIKRFLSDLSMLKAKYYSIVGSDDVFDGLDRAQMAAEELMRNAPENRGELAEDLDLGHEDDEPGMLKGDLYKIGKYSMELYQMMDDLEDIDGEVDLPHWWQSKVTTAKNMISGAKHYLEFELKEPAIDDMVTEDSLDDEAKVYFMQKVKRGEIDKLPEDPKAAFLAQMTKDQMDHDKETLRRERGLEEIGMFNDPVGYEKSQPNPRDKVFTKKYVNSGIYDIFKNGKKVKTINGEGEANAWMNAEMRKLKEDAFYTRDVKDAVVSKLMDQLRK
jgi:hypothetical protein